MSALTFQPVAAPIIYLDTADERPAYPPHYLTPAEQIERRIAARCPAAIREAEREEREGDEEHETPPWLQDYEAP